MDHRCLTRPFAGAWAGNPLSGGRAEGSADQVGGYDVANGGKPSRPGR